MDCKNIVSMESFINDTKKPNGQKKCPPCTLGIVANWYRSELEDSGQKAQADFLTNLVKDTVSSPLDIAKGMDKIKKEVPKNVESRLLDFDCSAQTYEKEG